MKSSAARGLYAFCLAHDISRSGDNSRLMMFHVLTLATRSSCFLFVLGEESTSLFALDGCHLATLSGTAT